MPRQPDTHNLSKRERQVMEIVYKKGQATAVEIHQTLEDPPSYSAVRGMLRVLEEKNLLTHTQIGKRNLYVPIVNRESAGKSALSKLIDTFFSGSTEEAVATLIDMNRNDLSEDALARLRQAIDDAREAGR